MYYRDSLCKQEFKRITDPIVAATKRTILRQVAPSEENETSLSDMEFRDALHLRYCRKPPNLPTHCDGCGAKVSLAQGLECKKGGKAIQRHDEIKFELQDLFARALIPSASHLQSATTHKSTQVVAHMLKRQKECLHQQKNVVTY